VVVKSLETHFRKVPGLSGATVLGDGAVALILDVGHLVRLSGREREMLA
jgi:two-component system, chemotaxis family, sensor kinase CheA